MTSGDELHVTFDPDDVEGTESAREPSRTNVSADQLARLAEALLVSIDRGEVEVSDAERRFLRSLAERLARSEPPS